MLVHGSAPCAQQGPINLEKGKEERRGETGAKQSAGKNLARYTRGKTPNLHTAFAYLNALMGHPQKHGVKGAKKAYKSGRIHEKCG